MNTSDVEAVYDTLAETLDTIGEAKGELFLAKLALLLSHEIGDAPHVLSLIAQARANLDIGD